MPYPCKHSRIAVLNFIVAFKTANDGNSPTLRDIMAATGISSTSVTAYILRGLQAKGLITVDDGFHRITVIGGRWTYTPPAKLEED